MCVCVCVLEYLLSLTHLIVFPFLNDKMGGRNEFTNDATHTKNNKKRHTIIGVAADDELKTDANSWQML